MGTSQSDTKKFKQILAEKLTSIYPPPETQVVKTEGKAKKPEQIQANNAHGLFTIKFESITCWGTGVMIGPNVVLTAGHNLYNFQTKTFADLETMKFSAGVDRDVTPFGSVEVREYFVSPNYVKEGKEDYGFLVLKEPIGEQTGYFGLTCSQPEERIIHEISGIEATLAYIYQEESSTNEIIHSQNENGIYNQQGYLMDPSGAKVFLTRAMYKQIYQWLQQTSFCAFLQLRNKERLALPDQGINAECISILMTCNLDGLAILDLSRNQIGYKEVQLLAKNTSWVNLSELNLSFNNIGVEGAKALAQNISWTKLSELYLGANSIGAEGAKALAQNSSWAYLSLLDLGRNDIGAEGAKALSQNTSWTKVSYLVLENNAIGSEGAKALAQNVSWINLTQLDLSSNNICAEGARGIAQNISWKKLLRLCLSSNSIGAKGVEALAGNASWTNLSVLELPETGINLEGVKALAENTSWSHLLQLFVHSNGIDSKEVDVLKQSKTWKNDLKILV